MDELEKTVDEGRRAELRAAFTKINAASMLTESTVWDVSPWDQGKWSEEDGIYRSMLARLKALDRGKRKRFPNQERDILIAETAIKNGLTLVSNDRNLRTVTTEFRGRAVEVASLVSRKR